jgi:hypothetical protein
MEGRIEHSESMQQMKLKTRKLFRRMKQAIVEYTETIFNANKDCCLSIANSKPEGKRLRDTYRSSLSGMAYIFRCTFLIKQRGVTMTNGF